MKRKVIILILLITTLISLVLYYTLATDITMKEATGEADLTYNIDINDTDGRTITVEAGKTKVFDIFVTNKNGGSIKYGLAYKANTSTDIKVKKLDTSKDDVTGTIDNDSTLQISLVIKNDSTSNLTYNIVPITGYINGGDLIVPSGYTMISEVYKFPTTPSEITLTKLGLTAKEEIPDFSKTSPLVLGYTEKTSSMKKSTTSPFIDNNGLKVYTYITYADSYIFDTNTGKYSLTNPAVVSNFDLQNNSTILKNKYIISIGFSQYEDNVSQNINAIYKVNSLFCFDVSSPKGVVLQCDFDYIQYDTTPITEDDSGIYSAEDDYGTSYYFRGASTNNYVKFANKYWRIIRINGDGTIRMIYDGTTSHNNGESSRDRQIGTIPFNRTYEDNAYIGYMMGIDNQCTSGYCSGTTRTTSYEQATTNTYSSTIKTTVDNWYKTNIKDAGFGDKVADVIYCNDRSMKSGTGVGTNTTYYKAYERLEDNKSPVLTCSQQNDAFTADDEIKGNGDLEYPVGLLTADEVSMAGGVNGSNSNYFLYTGNNFWTMSPFDFGSGVAFEFGVYSNGKLNGLSVYSTYGVRPVVSLKSDLEIVGTGTMTDPFVVQ